MTTRSLSVRSAYAYMHHVGRLAIVVGLLWAGPTSAATYTVTNTNDTGAGSLRQAILDANANSGWDHIEFGIGFVGSFYTISPGSALPAITEEVYINGWSQGGFGYSGPPLIELDGSSAGYGADGLVITGGGCEIEGLVINRFSANGILITTNGGNFISGNYIGTNGAGTADMGNGQAGIWIENSGPNTVGWTNPDCRNIISGNDLDGIRIAEFASTGNKIYGNYIGTNASGTAAIGNGDDGVYITGAPSNTVGGISTGMANLISGNGDDGISVAGINSLYTIIYGNFIGTNASGTAAIPNHYGIYINGAIYTTIGSSDPGGRNIISGSTYNGIRIADSDATGNVIHNNYIGTDVTGNNAIPNYDGIWITTSASGNEIGGTSANEQNRIAYNIRYGVCVYSGTANTISRNSIHSNGSLGIDLDADGVTANDYQDPDTGPNNLQNRPLLTSVTVAGGTTTVQGTLNSTPNRDFTVEFFENTTPDPSNCGEGASYFGTTTVHTNATTGSVSFNVSFPGVNIPDGYCVSATATDQTTDDTSEFSQVEYVVNTDIALTASLSGGSVVLNWTTASGAAAYWVYGASDFAYFPPGLTSPYQYRLAVLGPGTTTWSSTAGVGNPNSNWTYMVIAVNSGGSEISRSNRAGEFDFSSTTLR